MDVLWILLWFLLSLVLIGSTVWSLQILLRQKKAWEAYARKKGMSFNKGTFMGPAEVNGAIGEYKVAFFTAERQEADARRRRYVTGIEIGLPEGIFDGGVAGTQSMLPFMQTLTKTHLYRVEGWADGHYLFVRDDEPAKAYFTPERLELFETLLSTRNADVLIVFGASEIILRVETTDPMQDPDKIDKIVTRLTGLCDKLRITPEERKALAAMVPPEPATATSEP